MYRLVRNFNSRPYARGDYKPLSLLRIASNFNSRPYARGDGIAAPRQGQKHISIHAPTQGATSRHAEKCGGRAISIHAPTQGATPKLEYCQSNNHYFNSRPYARGDVVDFSVNEEGSYFNSRPYARGDGVPQPQGNSIDNFNSRPYARGDATITAGVNSISLFQFTPLRKGRQQKICVFSRSFVQPLQIIVL